ncbi:DNA polymerase III subunit alpha [Luteimonas sp. JM171]|uniref:DNA polymerase III subunit alpha n=1 Tax=Luteimonas sp. JM171 TaxID=1896164 RepID=UPI0008582B89|nr:DNA polymerase III subunit alpha [Luteimonas sp. JM171]AOH37286.1 DNA polymerase III subunit alpha [Luteimonas sp. JM171]
MSARFVHLHLRSEYSLVDSTIRIPQLVDRCVALGQPAVAVTDRNNLFALVESHARAEAAGVKPLAGADVMVASGSEPAWPVTLLCRNHNGYLTLSRLLSRAWLEGHRQDGVVVRPEWLLEHSADLFALVGRHTEAGRLAAAGKHELALQWLGDWQRAFDDRLHLELTRTNRDGEAQFNDFALHAASERGIPVVASNDVRFLERQGFDAHEARVCIASGRVLDDPRRPRSYSAEQYLKSAEEMAELFADVPDALDNTVALAQRCNFELSLGKYYLPAFPVPDDHTLDSWIRSESCRGLEERLEKHPLAEGHTRESYFERLDTELDVIVKMGFPGYFLIVADFINWAKEQGIPVGPGRGSGAGSLVAWALGITDLDPLPYDLLFERFLNPERVSMPDFDIDFCMDRRDEVIEYVARKYGRDRVSQIITYGTMAAKAVVRDVGRVLGYPYGMVDGIAKLVPMTLGVSLSDALGRTEKGRKDENWRSDELIARYNDEEDVRDLLDLALQLENLTRNAGKHAGGVVIAPRPLSDFCPLFAEHDEGGRGKNPVTQFDKDDVEAVGLVKFDFLGLRTLTIIDWAVKAINRRRKAGGEAPLDISALALDDKATYELFARGDTVAVFQFESRGMRELLKRAKPDTFEDIIALAALFRPGPLNSGMDKDWVDRKHGNAEVTYPHPKLEPVLAPTYGVIVYQEQVMQIAQVLAGYSLGGADLLRRAMGKKKPEEMAKERAKFEAGAAQNGVDPKVATSIFDLMEQFAEYGFNKSHSAAYALVAYQTAWLKTHYPAEFMAAVLSSDMDNTDKVVGFLDEARALGLTVLPPDVNASSFMFEAIDPQTIRYGLGAVKGVGRGACEAIASERANGGPYADLLDFCNRVDAGRMNRRTMEALTLSGALDGLGSNRASLMLQLPHAMKATEQLARERSAGQVSLFGGGDAAPALEIELPETAPWPLAQTLSGERETLGHYLSGHPIDPYRQDLEALVGNDLGRLDALWASASGGESRGGWRQEAKVVIAGLVTAMRRRGDSQAFVQLEDGRGRIECAFFSEAFQEYAPLLTRDRILIVEGGLREDEFSGGFSLRARRCWDFQQVCPDLARGMRLRLDLRDRGLLERVEQMLEERRPGSTPLRYELLLASGARGALDLNGQSSVRVDAELPGLLRADPGVREVELQLERPWTS